MAGAALFLLLVVLIVFAVPRALLHAVEGQAFVTPPAGAQRPDHFGAASTPIVVASGDRLLRASWVPAANASAPAIAIFHGDEEDISRWARVQAHLHHAGIASLVFDYSGYGASTGRPSVARLAQDAAAAWQRFVVLTPEADSRSALGFSLGAAVLADAVPSMRPAPQKVVLAAGFASARETAVAAGLVPAWAAWVLPDLWNSEAALARVKHPILIVHSRADEAIPVADAMRLCRAAVGPRRLVLLDGLMHDAPLDPAISPAFWDAVIAAIRAGGLPGAAGCEDPALPGSPQPTSASDGLLRPAR